MFLPVLDADAAQKIHILPEGFLKLIQKTALADACLPYHIDHWPLPCLAFLNAPHRASISGPRPTSSVMPRTRPASNRVRTSVLSETIR